MARILHLDDDPFFLSLIKAGLTKRGHEVLSVRRCQEADQVLSEGGIDLFILDVLMPDCNGKEHFDILKEHFPHLPVLFCTALNHTFDVSASDENSKRWSEGFADGLTDIIYKPFKLDQLHRKVNSLVEMGLISS